VAFDLPTLMGYDSDHPGQRGEVGKCGVAIDSLEDMEILFGGIDLEKTTVSMTINSPASVLWGNVSGGSREKARDWQKISGTISKRHSEGVHRAEGIYLSPAPSMRLVIDTFEFGSKFTPRLNTISISAITSRKPVRPPCRNWRSPCMTAWSMWSGHGGVLDVDDFGPEAEFFFNAHNDSSKRLLNIEPPANLGSGNERAVRREARGAHLADAIPHPERRESSLPAQQPMNNLRA